MTAVTSKMNRMVMLYMLALFMVSLPTSMARHLLVETADNQRGDDSQHMPKPPPWHPPPFFGGRDDRPSMTDIHRDVMKRRGKIKIGEWNLYSDLKATTTTLW